MRVPDDIPLNPWPNDMVIGVEECWEPLVFLLFVRSAWRLEIAEVPALESEPAVGNSGAAKTPGADGVSGSGGSPRADGVADAVALWRSDWARAWTPFACAPGGIGKPEPEVQQLLDTLTDEELWAATSTWPSAYWDAGVDRIAYEIWRETLPAPADELPEHRAIAALSEAWASGLTTIVVLPYAGHFAERINAQHLVVSATTRRDSEEYSRALRLAR